MSLDLKKNIPLYLQIVEDIIARISAGKFSVGDQIGSQQELCQEYRVSLITVKKALSHLSHHGWIYTHVGKGSFVARLSAPPPQPVHRSIGVVLENLQSPFFSLIVQAVEETAYERGYNVLLSNSSGRAEKEEQQIRHFRKIGVAGLIIASLRHMYHATPTIQMLHREEFPFVMVSYMDDPEIPHVGTDHEKGAFIATQHLARLGYRRIGYVNAERGNLVGELRKKGYMRGLSTMKIATDKRFVYRIHTKGIRDYYKGGYEVGRRFAARRGSKPDALFIYNDSAALGFQRAVLEAGLRVPEDVAMIGFDDVEQGEYAAVPLTTIHQPTAQIGRKAVDVLIRKIEGRKVIARTILNPVLVLRESSGGRSHWTHEAAPAISEKD